MEYRFARMFFFQVHTILLFAFEKSANENTFVLDSGQNYWK